MNWTSWRFVNPIKIGPSKNRQGIQKSYCDLNLRYLRLKNFAFESLTFVGSKACAEAGSCFSNF